MINATDVRFRSARPSDAEWAIRLIVNSATERFEHFHAHRTNELYRYLRSEFCSNTGLFSHKRHIAIEYLTAPIGLVSLFRCFAGVIHALGTLRHMFRSLGPHKTLSILHRRRLGSGRMPPLSWSSVYGDNLCIEQRFRGKGVGKIAMQYLFHLTAEQGFHYFYGDVGLHNSAARQLYEELEMTPVRVLHSSPLSPVDDLVRLRKELRGI